MASKNFYHNILLDIHFRQTHDLRTFLLTKKDARKKQFSKEYLSEQIFRIQTEITKEDVKEDFQLEFGDIQFYKSTWKIIGNGVSNKKKNFTFWFNDEKHNGKVSYFINPSKLKNIIYIFWGENKKCLYIGRSGNGGSRPLSHFEKYWFSKAKKIEIYSTTNSKRLNKLECLAIHYFQPFYNIKKSARQERSHICPICDKQKHIEKTMKKLFSPNKK